MPLNDVTVSIDIKYPSPRIGLGRPLILAKKTGTATYKEYSRIDQVVGDFATSTPEYKKAKAYFEQENRADLLAIATYETDPAVTLLQFYKRAWHFALIANDLSADQIKAADFFNTTSSKFKFGAYQVNTKIARTALKGKKRTIIFDHTIADEHLDAATLGDLASLTVGSITWKSKGEFVGITPRYLNDIEMAEIDSDKAIAYIMKSGKAQLSEGWLATGEFIDDLHGQDWVKVDMENEVQYAMQQAPKVHYDSRGISLLQAGATTTLQKAFNNGIIAQTDAGEARYTVSALSREQSDANDIVERIYRGLSFSYIPSGGIHTVPIKGEVLFEA